MKPAVVIVAALALALTACGGNDPEPSAATKTPSPTPTQTAGVSHDEFVDDLNRTCGGDEQRLKELSERLDESSAAQDYNGAADVIEDMQDLARPHWEQQHALEPPAEDEQAFGEYMDAQRQVQGAMARYVHALRAHDDEQLTLLGEAVKDVQRDRLRAALKLGADECGG